MCIQGSTEPAKVKKRKDYNLKNLQVLSNMYQQELRRHIVELNPEVARSTRTECKLGRQSSSTVKHSSMMQDLISPWRRLNIQVVTRMS